MDRKSFALALVLIASLAACGDPDRRPSVSDAGRDAAAPADAGGDAGAVPDAGESPDASSSCDCDTSGSCDGYCYCDTDCTNPCACDLTSWCDSGCGCDAACTDALADVYPYNLCHHNGDCPGGFCAKGACIAFCHATAGCGVGFECRSDTCLYECVDDSGCFGAGACCVDGVCLPGVLCAETVGPTGWTCPAEYFSAGDGCDCGCGITDPDCSDGTCDWCHDSDAATFLCPMAV